MSRRKKLKESKGQREKEEGNSTVTNQLVNHHDVNERRRDLFLQANNSQPWDKEAMMLDARIEGHDRQFRSGADENSSYFRCPDCNTEGPMLNPMRRDNRINGGMDLEEDRERRRMRMMMIEEERRKPGTHKEILSRDIPNKLLSYSNSNSSSHPRRDTFSQRPETLAAYKTHREIGESYRTGVEGRGRGQETTQCESCHRAYRPSEHNMRQGRAHTNMRGSALFDGFPPQQRVSDRGRYNQFDMMKDMDLRRERRNVTFDLESSRTRKEEGSNQGRGWMEDEAKTSRDKVKKNKVKVHSNRALKVKLNLSPLRKSKVHPKRKTEHGHLEKCSSKKSEDKRQHGKERGEKEGKSKKLKGSSEKGKKSTKTEGLIEDDVEEKEVKEGEQNSKSSSKQKKMTSKSEKGGQESAEGEKTQLENSQNTSSDTTNAPDQSHTVRADGPASNGQGPGLQGTSIQYQGAGLVVGRAQLSSQHPFSLSASERDRTSNLSLLGSASSQLTGSNISLQRGNVLLNSTAPVANAIYPGGPANTIAPGLAVSGPNMLPSGAPEAFSRQAGVGLISPATSLSASTVQANLLQASVIQTAPLYNSQVGGLAQNLAANPAINPAPIQSLSQSQIPPDSSPLIARLKLDPAQAPGLQTGEGSQTKEILTLPTQAPVGTDGSSVVTPQVMGAVTTVENLSNNNSLTQDGVPGGSSVNMSAGGVALTEGSAVGVSGGSMPAAAEAADVSVSGAPTQGGSSTDSLVAAAALLQQEYLSEDGGSSPRRKLRLVLPEKTSSRPPTALERKIR